MGVILDCLECMRVMGEKVGLIYISHHISQTHFDFCAKCDHLLHLQVSMGVDGAALPLHRHLYRLSFLGSFQEELLRSQKNEIWMWENILGVQPLWDLFHMFTTSLTPVWSGIILSLFSHLCTPHKAFSAPLFHFLINSAFAQILACANYFILKTILYTIWKFSEGAITYSCSQTE